MSNITYVPLANELLARLIQRYQHHYDAYVDHAVESFLERTEDDWNTRPLFGSGAGFVWDQLMLPEQTVLRTFYKGEWKLATLSSGKFEFDGKRYSSPAKACNAMRGGTSNNAWLSLELKRPQDVDFRLANTFRR